MDKKNIIRVIRGRFWIELAERVGFEPTIEFLPYTRLAGERLQPARPPLLLKDKRKKTKDKRDPDKNADFLSANRD